MTTTLTGPAQARAVTLYYRDGSSDKVYTAAVEPRGPGFVVTFAYGRRGGTLTTGTKTPTPVGLDEANRVYDRLVREKTSKGYTPGPDGRPYAGTERAGRVTCVLPQLLNPVDESDVDRLIADDDWWAQPKFDGRRVMVLKQGSDVTGINRTGLTIGLPEPVAAAVLTIPIDRCLIDGELVGDVYHCFDLLNRGDDDLRDEPYARRYDAALNLVDAVPDDALRYAETAVTTAHKRRLVDRLRREDAEGVVFKHRLAPYTHGRPHVGGPQLKLKFTATVSCRVAAVNAGRRSVAVELLDASTGDWAGVGNVTVPPNHAVPARGDVVEVRYLYAYRGGSLYQPVYLGRRDDVSPSGCRITQLKFRATDEGDGPGEA
jgi:bifunctional non-homologous end joining protein LigD